MSNFEQATVHHVTSTGWEEDPDQETWTISDLEYAMPQVYLTFSLVYETGVGIIQTDIINTIKDALAKTLSQCRTLVGEFKKEDGEVKIIRKRGSSIPLVVKQSNNDEKSATFADLEAAGFPPFKIDNVVKLVDIGDTDFTSMIKHKKKLCGFQITWIPGGMILSISYHHSCTDGAGFAQFLRQWTMNAFAMSSNPEIELPPWNFQSLDRGRLNGDTSAHINEVTPPVHPIGLVTVPLAKVPQQQPVILWFDKASIQRLKTAATSHIEGSSTIVSSYDAITALLWRIHTRARLTMYVPVANESTVLGQAIDLRLRFDPHLLPELQANATYGVLTPGTSVLDVVAEGNLPRLAELVREAHKSVTEEAAQERSRTVALLEDKTVAAWTGEVPRFGVAMSDMRGSGFYDADFGFGSPVAVRNVHQPGYPCVIEALRPPQHDDAVLEVQIPVDKPCLESFIRDSELLLYAEVISA